MPESRLTRGRIDELLRFLPALAKPGLDTEPAPVVEEFFSLASQPCWSDYGYDPATAGDMVRDDAIIARATLDQIKTMLTFCVRGERFCDGHWDAMIHEGRIGAILRRLQQLRDEAPDA